MIVYSLKVTKAKLSLACFCAVAIMITAAAVGENIGGKSRIVGNMSGLTNEERVTWLTDAGWEIEAEPTDIREVVIPKEFDASYTEYNNLQKMCGMDLTDYRGETVKQYSYTVTNYPGTATETVKAKLLVCNGKIIGGDINAVGTSGFVHGLYDIETVKETLAKAE